jgi:hypothetical protein
MPSDVAPGRTRVLSTPTQEGHTRISVRHPNVNVEHTNTSVRHPHVRVGHTIGTPMEGAGGYEAGVGRVLFSDAE